MLPCVIYNWFITTIISIKTYFVMFITCTIIVICVFVKWAHKVTLSNGVSIGIT